MPRLTCRSPVYQSAPPATRKKADESQFLRREIGMNRPLGMHLMWAIAMLLATACLPVRADPLYTALTLTDVMAAYGFTDHSVYGSTVLFRGRYATLAFENGSRKALFNGMTFYLNGDISKVSSDWLIRPADAAGTIAALIRPDAALASVPLGVVVIDPGHGGADPGTRVARRVEEKRLTLDLARRLKVRLRACGVASVLSRDRDAALTLEERCECATRSGASLFLSIHLNSSKDPATSGVETYIMPAAGYPSTSESLDARRYARPMPDPGNRYEAANLVLASYVHRGILSQTRAEDRGIRRARFFVIRHATCPAALVECGFLSNTREAGRLSEDSYRDAVAEGLARGILTYLVRARNTRLPAAAFQ